MAIETFTWATQRGEAPEITYRVRESKFGSGYRQTVGDGPNNKEDSYPVTVFATKAQTLKIMEFFDRHGGAKAFLWTTPLGELGLFTCKDPKPTPVGGGRFKVSATLERAFHP
ncbi:phage tail protein [Pseudomonas sp. MH2]|uniref:Phage tail protein n=1 Tax=Pseudomonas machongensis TaxID=3110229 RepID=A0ABU5VIV2_9PSED|nr:phage tail protein [Pseudomonas sp. MH2]MEA5673231.1 phage tail protein [Pseudomonas sp. MH2]